MPDLKHEQTSQAELRLKLMKIVFDEIASAYEKLSNSVPGIKKVYVPVPEFRREIYEFDNKLNDLLKTEYKHYILLDGGPVTVYREGDCFIDENGIKWLFVRVIEK